MDEPTEPELSAASSRRVPTAPALGITPRNRAIRAFLDEYGWGGLALVPLAADASFRSYYRLRAGGRSVVFMDAPPPQEDVGAYVAVSSLLRRLGFSAPAVFAEDRAQGFLLLEDFGDDTYTRLLGQGFDEPKLYTLAIDTLIALQRSVGIDDLRELPPYDSERLLAEAALLVDWYLPATLGAPLGKGLRDQFLALWQEVIRLAVLPGPTLVLRDYHIDNLMLLRARRGVQGCGLLDFQDAVSGPSAYDLVSLLEDARRDVPVALRQAMTERYLAAFPAFDRSDFFRCAAILSAQRNCKILGIFTRLWKRDGKPGYLVHIPRVWRQLEEDLGHPCLGKVADWLDRHLPPAMRRVPGPRGEA